jgi:hypothetical protein
MLDGRMAAAKHKVALFSLLCLHCQYMPGNNARTFKPLGNREMNTLARDLVQQALKSSSRRRHVRIHTAVNNNRCEEYKDNCGALQ